MAHPALSLTPAKGTSVLIRQAVPRLLRCFLIAGLVAAVVGPLAPVGKVLSQVTAVVAVSPHTAPSGATVMVDGWGFPAETELSALTFGRAHALPEPVPVTDASGNFMALVTVPDSPDGGALAPGPVVMRVTADNVVGRLSFTIPAPLITLSRDTAWPGEVLTITGASFSAGDNVDSINFGAAAALPMPNQRTNCHGAFTASVVVSALNPRDYTVMVRTSRNSLATASIKITSVPDRAAVPEYVFQELTSRGLLVLAAASPPGGTKFGAYVPDLPGDSLAQLEPNSVLVLTLAKDAFISVSKRPAVPVAAYTPTLFDLGPVVSIEVVDSSDRTYRPCVNVTPSVAVPGQEVTISGTSFPAETELSGLMFGKVNGLLEPVPLPAPAPVTDASGSFTISLTLPSVPDDGSPTPGTAVIMAAVGYVWGTAFFTIPEPSITLSSDEARPG